MKFGLHWEGIKERDAIRPLELELTYDMIAGLIAGTRDWFPGHHNPTYAQDQGKRNIYANTVFLHGFVDRAVLEWAGPTWFVHRRRMAMVDSAYPGDILRATGIVTAKGRTDAGLPSVDIELEGKQGPRLVINANVTLALPVRSQQLQTRNSLRN